MNKKRIMIAAVLAMTATAGSGEAQATSRGHGWHRHGIALRTEAHAGGRHFTHVARRASFRSLHEADATRTGSAGGSQVGRASFYSGSGRTANGGRVGSVTCAHRTLPFGTRVLVTNLANARQAVLTVNDRGPFIRGRLIDVSRGAAGLLGMLHAGVSQIRMQVLGNAG